MKNILYLILITVLLWAKEGSAQTESDWHGFKCLDFRFEERDAKIVFPEQAEAGRHWIWRARFWGHEPQTDIALLNVLSVEWANPLAIHGAPAPLVQVSVIEFVHRGGYSTR